VLADLSRLAGAQPVAGRYLIRNNDFTGIRFGLGCVDEFKVVCLRVLLPCVISRARKATAFEDVTQPGFYSDWSNFMGQLQA